MRIFLHVGAVGPDKAPALFLACKVEDTAGGLGYSGFRLEAGNTGAADGRAYVVNGSIRHHALAMPGDLQELSLEDQVELLEGILPAAVAVGPEVYSAPAGEGKDTDKGADSASGESDG